MEVRDFERSVGRYVQDIFGPDASALLYGDDDNEYSVAILHGPDCPDWGTTSYSTVGLSNFFQDVNGASVRVEVISASATEVVDYPLALSSCFFEHVKNSTNIIYGTVIPDILEQYNLSPTLKHFTFVAPFLWQGLSRAKIAGEDVLWLYAIGITDAERRFLAANGIDELEKLFVEQQIDLFDISRASVV